MSKSIVDMQNTQNTLVSIVLGNIRGTKDPCQSTILSYLEFVEKREIRLFIDKRFDERGTIFHLWSDEGTIDSPTYSGGPFLSIDLKEVERAFGGFIDGSDVVEKVDSFGGHGEAEILISVKDWNKFASEGKFDWETLNGDDAAFGDVVDHIVFLGPTLSDSKE